MVDSRPVMEQYNELLHVLGQFKLHKIGVDESYAVSSLIDKLSPSWKDFKRSLKHQDEKLSLVQFGSHLRIEENLRVQENDQIMGEVESRLAHVHLVEDNKSNPKDKRKYEDHDKSNKKSKGLVCWRCQKVGHVKRDCRVKLNKNGAGTSGSGQERCKDLVPRKGG
ncbi:unnamed protein product [Cuscuta europaea]|uniref:CCHC-type domain-containing protein n=1 Tax=Cuscuta europaea TaxID=41803 RepID=A0A9P0Z9K2_CUSEU|nr:unnamed protein product [Cuscuta europaea]